MAALDIGILYPETNLQSVAARGGWTRPKARIRKVLEAVRTIDDPPVDDGPPVMKYVPDDELNPADRDDLEDYLRVGKVKAPWPDKPGTNNWVERYNALGGKTNWIRRTAEHLRAEFKGNTGRAIATAVNAAEKMCATGDTNWPGKQSVNPGSRAQACAAVARWNAAKAAARASRS